MPFTCQLLSPGSEIKAITQNHFGNQVVGRARETDTEAEIDLPLRSDIQINRRENLVLLLRDRIESRDWADRTVIFQTSRDFRSQIVAEFEVRRKDNALLHALTMKGPVQCRVQGPIPSADLLVHDRTDFPRPMSTEYCRLW